MREIKMGMEKEQFIEIMTKLDGAYPKNCFSAENVINTWWEFFGRYDPDIFSDVVSNWIVDNGKAPAIADLKSECTRAQLTKYKQMEKEDGVPANTYINSDDWRRK